MPSDNIYRVARKAALLTQTELAIACDVSERTIRKLENGDNVSFETVKAARAVLGMGEAVPEEAAIMPTSRMLSPGAIWATAWFARIAFVCMIIQIFVLAEVIWMSQHILDTTGQTLIAIFTVAVAMWMLAIRAAVVYSDYFMDPQEWLALGILMVLFTGIPASIALYRPVGSSDLLVASVVAAETLFLSISAMVFWIGFLDKDPSTGRRAWRSIAAIVAPGRIMSGLKFAFALMLSSKRKVVP